MSTKIIDTQCFSCVRFYGGVDRGICYQIYVPSASIVLTEKQFGDMVIAAMIAEINEASK